MDGHEFEVIGTMLRPAASFFGDTDNRVLLPYWTHAEACIPTRARTPSW